MTLDPYSPVENKAVTVTAVTTNGNEITVGRYSQGVVFDFEGDRERRGPMTLRCVATGSPIARLDLWPGARIECVDDHDQIALLFIQTGTN